MTADRITAEKSLQAFVERLGQNAASNLLAVILYGSAAGEEYDPRHSDLNVLCILRDLSYSTLQKITPSLTWWAKQKQRPPLLMTRQELESSADVFAIELLDMKAKYRVLFGEDVLRNLEVPMHLHRAQLEYELREKLILLRQRLVTTMGDDNQIRHLLVHSFPSFVTLFRHALIAGGNAAPQTKRGIIRELSTKLGLDGSVFEQVLALREDTTEGEKPDVSDLAARYLQTVDQVTAAVDKMLDTSQSS
jgi:hypothetical protein